MHWAGKFHKMSLEYYRSGKNYQIEGNCRTVYPLGDNLVRIANYEPAGIERGMKETVKISRLILTYYPLAVQHILISSACVLKLSA
jgi:hypothetical protein